MIPLLLSLAFGAGIYLIYEGLTDPRLPATQPRRLRGVEEFLIRAGLYDVTPRDFLIFSIATSLVVGLFVQLFLGWGIVSLLAAGLGLVAPFTYYMRRHDRRRAAVQLALVEAIGQLRDAIRTGLSVQEALVGLARSGPDTLRPEFTQLVREIRLLGFERAVAAMRSRLADPVFDVVAATLLLNDRLGGRNVSQVLDRLAQATRAELRVQQELRAYQARNVLSARIVAAVPLVVLVAVRQVNPGYLTLFNDWSGQVMLAGCLISVAVGYAGMLWMTRLPGERRVLQQ
ncbi:MAG: type II secretion system F family protein [Chloroflexi bacterium]|nr:type II secretion system F family protein [Chloroflexota bacterium]